MKELPYSLTEGEREIVVRRVRLFKKAEKRMKKAQEALLRERMALQDVLAAIRGGFDSAVHLDLDQMALIRAEEE